ncbi:hypothetical protein L2D14_08375 [Thalassospiraceae bacterium LMO-JJ14]|nr:hypothetical protein L2D14_08375 [Thalassospiraceae bacterium LMO-JJ14]
MNSNQRSKHSQAPSIFTSGEVEQAIREGRRLQAEAMRGIFSRLRRGHASSHEISLSPTG